VYHDRFDVTHWIHRLAFGLVGLCCVASAGATPADPDPAFGTAGEVHITATEGTRVLSLLRRPDGRIVALVDFYGLVQFRPDGSLDESFGGGDGVLDQAAICGAFRYEACQPAAIALQDDGAIVVAVGASTQQSSPYVCAVVRVTPAGTLDRSFGTDGGAVFPDVETNDVPAGIAVQSDGGLIVGGTSFDFDANETMSHLSLARFLPSGTPDPQFGMAGRLRLPVTNAFATAFTQQPDGRLVLAGGTISLQGPVGTIVARLTFSGQLDAAFADHGVYRDDSLLAFRPRAMAVQAEGRLVLAGTQPGTFDEQIAVLRLDRNGNAEFLTAITPLPGDSSAGNGVAIDSRGRILVAGTVTEPPRAGIPAIPVAMLQTAVARLNADGAPDRTFAAHGATTMFDGLSSEGTAIVTGTADSVIVGSTSESAPFYTTGTYARRPRAVLFGLTGGDSPRVLTLREGRAVEYYHAGFDHYFVSATPDEIASLNTYSSDWQRTGRTFKVWTEGSDGVNPVCRFFSDQSFAPKSSHFYTPYPAECSSVRAGGVWLYEGIAFQLGLPVGAPGAGTCLPGSAPLYRLYNNGQGGAPNHRYANDASLVDSMLARGWIFEGEAQTRVFACIPQ
jgi:uncharacterized delta-60 repeat protein